MPTSTRPILFAAAIRLAIAFGAVGTTGAAAHAATLELSFDQASFASNTSGAFRLTGAIPATGYGSSSSDLGVEYYSFSSDYTLSFTDPPPVPYTFFLQATSASGTAVRDSTAYTIKSTPGIELNIFSSSGFGQLQVFLDPIPDPNFSPAAFLPDGTQGTFVVDITGLFVATAAANGSSPASQGLSLDNLAGNNASQNPGTSGQTLDIALSAPVPEPTTSAMAALAAGALLLHCRRLTAALGPRGTTMRPEPAA